MRQAFAAVLWMFCPPDLRAGHMTESGVVINFSESVAMKKQTNLCRGKIESTFSANFHFCVNFCLNCCIVQVWFAVCHFSQATVSSMAKRGGLNGLCTQSSLAVYTVTAL